MTKLFSFEPGWLFIARLLFFQIWFFYIYIRVFFFFQIEMTLIHILIQNQIFNSLWLWLIFLVLAILLFDRSYIKSWSELKSYFHFKNIWSNIALIFFYQLYWHLNNMIIKKKNYYLTLLVHHCSNKKVILFMFYHIYIHVYTRILNSDIPIIILTCNHIIWFRNKDEWVRWISFCVQTISNYL